jgi:YggT family protein
LTSALTPQLVLFHVANYALAMMLYAVLARFVLGLFVDENWTNFIWRGFKLVSHPAVWVARRITPAAIPQPLLLIFTAIWLMAARIALFAALSAVGAAPSVTAG